jgi:hypothetical protein
MESRKTKPSGPYVVDCATVPVGGYITLSVHYSGDHFKEGDRLRVIGYGETKDDRGEDCFHRGLFFGGNKIYPAVVYQVAVFDHRTGKKCDTATIFPNETDEYRHDEHFKKADKGVILKPAIKALRAAGFENAARVIEYQRFLHLQQVKDRRRKQLRERFERDMCLSWKATARMSVGSKVDLRFKKDSTLKTYTLGGSEGESIILYSDKVVGAQSFLWDEVTYFRVQGETT